MKIDWNISTGLVGCDRSGTVEIDDQDLEGYDEDEKRAYIEEYIQEVVSDYVEWGWSEAE